MKVLNIIDIPWYSGVTSYAVDSSAGLFQRGHKIFFAGVKKGLPLKIASENGFGTVEICGRNNPFIFRSISRLKNLIEKEKIDIVVAHTGRGYFWAYLVLLISGKKFAIIRTKSDALRPKKSFLYKKTKKIIAASEFIERQYLEIGLAPEKVVTVYQGIKLPTSAPRPPSPPVIGIVGRLDPVKGHGYFLGAAKIVLKEFPGAKFLVAGKEENIKYKELKKLAEKFGIEKSVEFCDYVENVFEFMSRCSVGVVASVGSEVVSRVLLEWLSCGKPVVAASVGCIPEILDEKFLVPPRNPEQLARKISEFLRSPLLMENTAEGNRKKIEEKFGYEEFINKTERAYSDVL